MKKTILLLLLCFYITTLSAQQTWIFDTKNSKIGEPIQGKLITVQPSEKYPITSGVTEKYPTTSGECLVDAGTYYLFGTGLSLAGAAIALSNITDENPGYTRLIAGGVVAVGGLVFTIVGHTKLVKAGAVLNEERKISLHPSSSGIGLALKF